MNDVTWINVYGGPLPRMDERDLRQGAHWLAYCAGKDEGPFENVDGEETTAADAMLSGALDIIEYTRGADGECVGAEVLVAFGGPSVRVQAVGEYVIVRVAGASGTVIACGPDVIGLYDEIVDRW